MLVCATVDCLSAGGFETNTNGMRSGPLVLTAAAKWPSQTCGDTNRNASTDPEDPQNQNTVAPNVAFHL